MTQPARPPGQKAGGEPQAVSPLWGRCEAVIFWGQGPVGVSNPQGHFCQCGFQGTQRGRGSMRIAQSGCSVAGRVLTAFSHPAGGVREAAVLSSRMPLFQVGTLTLVVQRSSFWVV